MGISFGINRVSRKGDFNQGTCAGPRFDSKFPAESGRSLFHPKQSQAVKRCRLIRLDKPHTVIKDGHSNGVRTGMAANGNPVGVAMSDSVGHRLLGDPKTSGFDRQRETRKAVRRFELPIDISFAAVAIDTPLNGGLKPKLIKQVRTQLGGYPANKLDRIGEELTRLFHRLGGFATDAPSDGVE